MKDETMKTATDAQKLAALTGLISAAEQLIKRGGASKTWRLITTFKAKKALRLTFGRAPKNDEVGRLVSTIKEVKATAKAAKPASNGAHKPARPAKAVRATRPARSVKPKRAKKVIARKAAAPTPAATAPAATATVAAS